MSCILLTALASEGIKVINPKALPNLVLIALSIAEITKLNKNLQL